MVHVFTIVIVGVLAFIVYESLIKRGRSEGFTSGIGAAFVAIAIVEGINLIYTAFTGHFLPGF